ncbi:S41 family peptidase [Myxococcota bacterium]|nr:S41 family peptidase [Myxococcota bacterium]MBU1536129.1 S41 family peptidase [Myxococcota bacterium]
MQSRALGKPFHLSSWRHASLYGLPVVAVILALLLTVLGRPSPQEQARRILLSYNIQERLPLKTLSSVLLQVKQDYLDPRRIDPLKMFLGATRALERNIPEISVNQTKDNYTVHIAERNWSINLAKITSPLILYKNLLSIFSTITAALHGIDTNEIERDAINGMLKTLDPHTTLLSPDVYQEMKTGTRGSFSGIGIVVVQRAEYLTVIAPIDDTPAAKAGVKAGDRIVKIGDSSTLNISLSEAVNLLRGKPNTSVTIWIERKGAPNLLRFDLTRTIIRLTSVSSRVLSHQTGYLRIKQFTQTTSQELSEHLTRLKKRGITSLILDLYNNPGGLLKQASKCADIFLDEGIVFTTVSQGSNVGDPISLSPENTLWSKGLVVLINKGSASASEILAGALKHHGKALILGETSFGKGSIQMISENEDGSALKMTIAHYLSAGKIAIQSRGVNPHVFISTINPESSTDGIFSDTHPKKTEGERADIPALGHPDDPPWTVMKLIVSSADRESVGGSVNSAPAPLIALSRRLLQTINTQKPFNREAIVALIKGEEHAEMHKLMTILGKKGIDWALHDQKRKGYALESTIRFTSGRKIMAGDTLKGTVELRNLGTDPAYRLRALIRNTPSAPFKDLLFGTMNPGASKSLSFSYHVDAAASPALWPLKITFVSNDPTMDPKKLPRSNVYPVQITPAPKPDFAIHYHLMDDVGGNGDGLCQPGEKIRLRIMLTNRGRGTTRETMVSLKNRSGTDAVITKGRYRFGRLLPGETRTEDFSITIRRKVSRGFLQFLFTAEDSGFDLRTQYVMTMPIHAVKPGPMEVGGFFSITRNSIVREGMDEMSTVLGIAYAGTTFPILGTGGKWVKIQLHPERSAFILMSQGHVVEEKSFNLLKPRWKPIYQIVSPTISVVDLPLQSVTPVVPMTIMITHPESIMDVYVENFGTAHTYKKLFYVSGKGKKSLKINRTIRLRPGINLIKITARTTRELLSQFEQVVYHDAP